MRHPSSGVHLCVNSPPPLPDRCTQPPSPVCPAQTYRYCDHFYPCSVCGARSMYLANLAAYWSFRCAHGYTVLDGGKVVRTAEVE